MNIIKMSAHQIKSKKQLKKLLIAIKYTMGYSFCEEGKEILLNQYSKKRNTLLIANKNGEVVGADMVDKEIFNECIFEPTITIYTDEILNKLINKL